MTIDDGAYDTIDRGECLFDRHGGLRNESDDVPAFIQVEWRVGGIQWRSAARPDAVGIHLDDISGSVRMHLQRVEDTWNPGGVALSEREIIVAQYLEQHAIERILKQAGDGVIVGDEVRGYVIPPFGQGDFQCSGTAVGIQHQGFVE